MLMCSNCRTGVPDGMRFCLQCGAAIAPPTPPAPSAAEPVPPAERDIATVSLKIAATPVISPRVKFGERPEIDDEEFKKSFTRQGIAPGTVVCRFCKSPLDLYGDFCEQCGAPVTEAAPAGVEIPRREAIRPPAPAIVPPPPPAAAPVRRPGGGGSTTSVPAPTKSAPSANTTRSIPTRATVPPPAPVPEQPSGLMGRLRGIFKKD